MPWWVAEAMWKFRPWTVACRAAADMRRLNIDFRNLFLTVVSRYTELFRNLRRPTLPVVIDAQGTRDFSRYLWNHSNMIDRESWARFITANFLYMVVRAGQAIMFAYSAPSWPNRETPRSVPIEPEMSATSSGMVRSMSINKKQQHGRGWIRDQITQLSAVSSLH